MESCRFREGSKKCTWWLSGCVHPLPLPTQMSAEDWGRTCRACALAYGNLPRRECVDEEVKI
jgi:hypothetical protein